MDISKLFVGQEVKNYIEMCKLLGQIPVKGKSRQLQVKNWERYFRFDRNKQKIIIKEIFEIPMAKEDK